MNNSLNALHFGSLTKVQFLDSLTRSSEVGQKRYVITGITGRRLIEGLRRRIRKVPLVRYPVSLAANILLLPRRIHRMRAEIMNHAAHLRYIQEQLDTERTHREAADKRFDEEKMNREIIQEKLDAEIKQREVIQFALEIITQEKKREEEQKYADKNVMDKIYLSYGLTVMGNPRHQVKDRLQPYIEKIDTWVQSNMKDKTLLNITDLGCGFGEWLELLEENGYKPVGVDDNPYVTDWAFGCNPRLDIRCQNAFDYLAQCADSSLDAITCFHMIEHLNINALFQFLNDCYRVLKQGGLFLIVAPNAQNLIVATYLFHCDLTHNKMIPNETLQFLCTEWGFKVVELIMLNPLNFITFDEYKQSDPLSAIAFRFNLSQEYGILAVKE